MNNNDEENNQLDGLVVYETNWDIDGGYSFDKKISGIAYFYSFSIPVENLDYKGLDISDNGTYFLYFDGKLKVYDRISQKIIDTDFEYNHETEYSVLENDKNELLGFSLDKGFYNIKLNKIMYKNINNGSFYYETDNLVSASSADENNEYSYLLNIMEEKIIQFKTGPCGYTASKIDDKFILVEDGGCVGPSRYLIYNMKHEKVIDDFFSSYEYNFESEYLYVNVDNSLYRYDENGNYEVLGTYEKLFQIFEDNSIVYLKDGYLYYENQNHNISKNVLKWESKYDYDPCMSGLMSEFDEPYMQFTVVYNKIEGDEGYTLYIRYDLNTKEIITEEEKGYPGHDGC